MKEHRAMKLIGGLGIAGGVAILLGFTAERSQSETPTITLPGPYPYETPVQVEAPPPVSDSSPMPSPAPFPYTKSATLLPAAQDRDSRTTGAARRPLAAKAVRKAAFKYNGVPKFCGFLAALPADVSVFDPKLGKTRALVKRGRVMDKNVAWFRKYKLRAAHE